MLNLLKNISVEFFIKIIIFFILLSSFFGSVGVNEG